MGDGPHDPRLSDLVSSRSDLVNLRSRYKQMAQQARDDGNDVYVEDMLALAPKNDAAYIRPSDLEKAEWVAEIYDAEGQPEVHPRGFHYRIIDKDYERRNGDPYANTRECWQELKEAFFWAQILGFVDADRVQDEQNDTPESRAFRSIDRPQPRNRSVQSQARETIHQPYDGYHPASIATDLARANIDYTDAEEFITDEANRIVEDVFIDVYYDALAQQPYYVEIWAEKSRVVPAHVADEYGATVRESEGEFSYKMCRSAVEVAEQRGQNLLIVIISDWDPKGRDMPKSVARKIEIEAIFHDLDAEVVHAGVTKEQVIQHAIPGTPASKPRGLEYGNPGAKGYETHKDLFREYAGQEPVEIQAFQTRYPGAFAQAVEDAIAPYFDRELGDKIQDAVEEARKEAFRRVVRAFGDDVHSIQQALDDVQDALGEYEQKVQPAFDAVSHELEQLRERELEVREQVGLTEKRDVLKDVVDDIDWRNAIADVDVPMPEPDAEGQSQRALLDTRRGLKDQLAAYKRFDVRVE